VTIHGNNLSLLFRKAIISTILTYCLLEAYKYWNSIMAVRAKKRKDGSIAWYYNIMIKGVRYRGIGGTTKTQALRTQDKIRSLVISGQYEDEKKVKNPKIQKFAEVYLDRRQHLKSKKRDILSVKTLLQFFKGNHLSDITPNTIEDYIAYRLKVGVKNGTINRELACLKHMYNLAIKWGDARKNPVSLVKFLKEPPGRTRYLTNDEANLLLDCSMEHLHPIILTALNTGMRLGEILNLTWDRVYIDHVIDPYIELKETKNNKNRFVPLSDDMIKMFRELKIKNGHSNFVFLSIHGQRLQSVRKPFENAVKKAGILDFRFHDLRHTFASHFIMNGGDLLTLKEILGHSSLVMVQRYAHLGAAHKRRQINYLNGMFGNGKKKNYLSMSN